MHQPPGTQVKGLAQELGIDVQFLEKLAGRSGVTWANAPFPLPLTPAVAPLSIASRMARQARSSSGEPGAVRSRASQSCCRWASIIACPSIGLPSIPDALGYQSGPPPAKLGRSSS